MPGPRVRRSDQTWGGLRHGHQRGDRLARAAVIFANANHPLAVMVKVRGRRGTTLIRRTGCPPHQPGVNPVDYAGPQKLTQYATPAKTT